MSYLSEATIRKHRIKFPIYLPDATRAVVRSLESGDLRQCQTEAVVVNTFHLLFEPGLEGDFKKVWWGREVDEF